MTLGRLAVSVLAGALALGGAVAALPDDPQPAAVQAIDLNDDGAKVRRDDAAENIAAVEDEGDDDTEGGDATEGNDGTGGGDHTGDRDATDVGDSGEGTTG